MGVRGHVDGAIGGALVGWAQPLRKDMGELRVGLYVRGALLAQAPANIFRGDLEAAGIGTGHYGFAIPLTETLQALVAANGGHAEICVQGPTPVRIGSWTLEGAGTDDTKGLPHDSTALQKLLYGDLQLLTRLMDGATSGQMPEPVGPRPLPPTHATLFSDRDYIDPDARLPEQMFGYAEYIRYRDRLDEQFDTARNPADIAHFYKRYLGAYSTMRGGLRVPLSRAAIDYLNEPVVIGGQKNSFTRALWAFVVDVPPIVQALDLSNDDWYGCVLYWWAYRQAHAIHCEDCLVPDFMADHLRAVPPDYEGKTWAPSDFMLRVRMEVSEFKALDLAFEDDRCRFACAMMLQALSQPDILRYMPAETIDAALTKRGGALPLASLCAELGTRLPGLTRAAYARALRLQGFDLDARRFLTFTAEGHRLEYAQLPPVPEAPPVDLQVIGPYKKASGLGQATRLSSEMLERSGFAVNKVDFGLDNPAPEGFSRAEAVADYRRAKVNLIHLNAEAIPLVYAYQPDVFTGAYNIGYFFWELDSPGACHYLGMDMLDEIWVSTEYGVQVFQPHTDIPVTNVGMSFEALPEIDRTEARSYLRKTAGIKPDDFAFMVTFDSFSFVQRKNPLGVLEAFRTAFPDTAENAHVRLVIKTQNRTKIADPAQIAIWEKVDAVLAQDKRIVLINETLAYEDLLRLKKGADAYLSLHRAEGWGFGMIEAMNLRVPVICTQYSGNVDFCPEGTCWPVDYTLTELGPHDYIFVRPGQKWAEPDVDDAARQMRALYDDPQEAKRRAEAAWNNVQTAFGETAIAKRYGARMHEILAGLDAGARTKAQAGTAGMDTSANGKTEGLQMAQDTSRQTAAHKTALAAAPRVWLQRLLHRADGSARTGK
mgnify:CR=1 FL=1